jgi:hypothetical protein
MGLDLNVQLEKVDRVLQTMLVPPRSNLGVSSDYIFANYSDQILLQIIGESDFMGDSDVYICFDESSKRCTLGSHHGDESVSEKNENYKLDSCVSSSRKIEAFVTVCKRRLAPRNGIQCTAVGVTGRNIMEITITDGRFVRNPEDKTTLLFVTSNHY